MRQIKFRGRKSNGEWIYGDLVHNVGVGASTALIFPEEAHDSWDKYIVLTDTIGQFTGLHDKNGKEIYFDDIVRNKYGDIGSVIWFSDWSLRVDWGGGDIHFIDPEWGLEVIGNIHDNPELLNE